MADWNGSSGSIIRPYRSYSGSPGIRHFEESTAVATAVIRRGDVVTFDTVVTSNARRILRAPSSGGTGTNLMQIGIKSLVGVALQDSTSDGSTAGLLSSGGVGTSRLRFLAVAPATPDQEFVGQLSTAGAGPALAGSTLIGRAFPLLHNRTLGRWFIDSTNSTRTQDAVEITDINPDYIGDSGAVPVIFKFLSTNLAPAIGSYGVNQPTT